MAAGDPSAIMPDEIIAQHVVADIGYRREFLTQETHDLAA
jgi:hypothetical protein